MTGEQHATWLLRGTRSQALTINCRKPFIQWRSSLHLPTLKPVIIIMFMKSSCICQCRLYYAAAAEWIHQSNTCNQSIFTFDHCVLSSVEGLCSPRFSLNLRVPGPTSLTSLPNTLNSVILSGLHIVQQLAANVRALCPELYSGIHCIWSNKDYLCSAIFMDSGTLLLLFCTLTLCHPFENYPCVKQDVQWTVWVGTVIHLYIHS